MQGTDAVVELATRGACPTGTFAARSGVALPVDCGGETVCDRARRCVVPPGSTAVSVAASTVSVHPFRDAQNTEDQSESTVVRSDVVDDFELDCDIFNVAGTDLHIDGPAGITASQRRIASFVGTRKTHAAFDAETVKDLPQDTCEHHSDVLPRTG